MQGSVTLAVNRDIWPKIVQLESLWYATHVKVKVTWPETVFKMADLVDEEEEEEAERVVETRTVTFAVDLDIWRATARMMKDQ